MKKAKIPSNENERLGTLKSYKILDTLPEEEYDALVKIASSICNVPVALISLVDNDRQWFKSKIGVEASETSRDIAFCAHTILNPDDIFEIKDSKKDKRFHDNPLVTGSTNVAFYAGAPLNTSDGFTIGALCVIDNKPNELTDDQKQSLKLLANQVVILLELRKSNNQLRNANRHINNLNNRLSDFSHRLTHDLKAPISNINFLLNIISTDYNHLFKDTEAEEFLDLISNRVFYMENFVKNMLEYATVSTKNIEFNDFSLFDLINNIVKNIDFEGRITLNSNLKEVSIYGSKIAFLIIFQNLISNSRKYSDEESIIIDIEYKEDDSAYHFVYKDNGPGIPEEYWTKVFEMFETLGTSNDSTGIGLGTVKSSIERLGGNIYLSKRDDNKKGVCFNFSISKKNPT